MNNGHSAQKRPLVTNGHSALIKAPSWESRSYSQLFAVDNKIWFGRCRVYTLSDEIAFSTQNIAGDVAGHRHGWPAAYCAMLARWQSICEFELTN